jgi:hypothetical protein
VGLEGKGRAHVVATFCFRRRTSSCTAPCAECSCKLSDDKVDSPNCICVFVCVCVRERERERYSGGVLSVCVCVWCASVNSGRIQVNTNSDESHC